MELPEEENTPEKRVDRIFAMMDKVRSTLSHFSLLSIVGIIKPFSILCKGLRHCQFINS